MIWRDSAPVDCGEVGDMMEEFALGLLDGAERATVVGHLERCRICGARAADLAEVAEQLLLVAPSVEPPAGFEQGVLARLETPSPWRRRRWRLGGLALAAALALVVAVGGTLVGVVRGGGEPDEVSADLMSLTGEHYVGHVVLTEDEPMSIEVDMEAWMDEIATWDDPPVGPWTLAVERADGVREEHRIRLTEDPTPHIELQPGDTPVRSVSIEDGAGQVWCSAEF